MQNHRIVLVCVVSEVSLYNWKFIKHRGYEFKRKDK